MRANTVSPNSTHDATCLAAAGKIGIPRRDSSRPHELLMLLLLLAALLPAAPAHADAAPAARELAACDALALARPAAVPALAANTSSLVRSCGGFSGHTFSALVRNPNRADIGVYLGVGAAQCGAV